MKGPSLDAIRKFKEQQERKKREEDERKIKEKLSTLEHRAAQGDRKAKQELKKIERIKEERNKAPEPTPDLKPRKTAIGIGKQTDTKVRATSKKPPVSQSTNFADLMRLAKQNNNEIKKPVEPTPMSSKQVPKSVSSKPKVIVREKIIPADKVEASQSRVPPKPKPAPVARSREPQVVLKQNPRAPPPKPQVSMRSKPVQPRPQYYIHPSALPNRSGHDSYRHDDYDDEDEEDEDEYERDDFVVDEDDDDIQDEVSRTIRSVFRYDKRKCDRREEELDRQYRAIGNVSTFEDLEREERRAARLAAAEDAQAFREEEERKRKKKIRLKKYDY